MKIPRNILEFAGSEKNLTVYTMFRDYWNHYKSLNGSNKIEFAEVDDKGNKISFDEKEQLMNAALRREIARIAGVAFDEFPMATYASHPNVQWAAFAVVSALVDMILPESIIETTGMYTDVRTGGFGDSFAFEVKPRDLFVVSRAGHGQRTTEVKKQFNGMVTILPEMREITVGVSLYRVLSGLESLADFVAKAVKSLETQMTVDIYNAFASAMNALPSTATTGLQVAGFSMSSMISLAQRISAWNSQKAIIMGTSLALLSVLPDDANYRYTLSDPYVTLGYIPTAAGYDIIRLPQVVDLTTPFGSVLANDRLWIISPGQQKIVKLCLEGTTLSNTTQPFQNANLTQTTTLFKSYGVGVATSAVAGLITL